MKKILLISANLSLQNAIEEEARKNNLVGVSLVTTDVFDQERSWWEANAPDLLVINFPADEVKQARYIMKIKKDIPNNLPLLLLSHSMSPDLIRLTMNFLRVRVIKSPFLPFAVLTAVKNLIETYEEGKQQAHPRYLTNQIIEVVKSEDEGKIKGKMKNLSLSGAYFESRDEHAEINPGDFAKMSIMIGEPLKYYSFDIRVVWKKPVTGSDITGYGVTFVNQEDFFNSLLKNVT